jgi:DNA-binding LacI/PurR family transcriptional regulator
MDGVRPSRPGRRLRRATLADVARAAGVSASTASLAVNGAGPVSPATRDRVLTAARELGYLGPDPLARSLRRGRCGVVAVVVSDRLGYAFRDPMMTALLDGLAEEIGAAGSSLLLVPVSRDPGAAGPDAARLGALAMDAVVLMDCGVRVADLLPGVLARGTVAVTIDGPAAPGVPDVGIDDEGGTRALVDHLGGLGHRDLGVITLPLVGGPQGDDGEPGVPRRRTAAARAAIGALPGGHARLVTAGRNTVEEGERAAGLLLDDLPRGDRRPTAIVAQSDVLAHGCLRAASARGLAVPGELSVTGFDGVDLHLLSGARLTTIEQPSQLKGQVAARLVLAALAGGRPDDVRLPISLRIGTTTGPPADRPAGPGRTPASR